MSSYLFLPQTEDNPKATGFLQSRGNVQSRDQVRAQKLHLVVEKLISWLNAQYYDVDSVVLFP